MFFYVLLIVAALHTGVHSQDCSWINSLNCNSYSYKPLCGSDHVTYDSRCAFAKAHCKNPSISVLASTPCRTVPVTHSLSTTTTTTSTSTIGVSANNSVCRDDPGFPCDNMLEFGMCSDPAIADKCKQTCVQDEPGLACEDLMKSGLCGASSVVGKCNYTCGQCYSGPKISIVG